MKGRRESHGIARPELGIGKIHQDAAGASGLLARSLEATNHAEPDIRIVVRAINAHAIHAALGEIADEFVIRGGVGRHDANRAAGRRRTKGSFRLLFEQLGAFTDGRLGRGRE